MESQNEFPNRFAWESEILDGDLPSTTRLVLLVLRAHINEKRGCAWPTVKTIARKAGLTERATLSELKRAIETGWLRRERRYGSGGGRGGRWRYFPQIPAHVKSAPMMNQVQADHMNNIHVATGEKCADGEPGSGRKVNNVHPNRNKTSKISAEPTARARARGSEPASVSAILNPIQNRQAFVNSILAISGDARAYDGWWFEVINRMDITNGLHVLDQAVQYAHDCSNEQTRNTKDLGLLEQPGAYIAAKCRDWLYQHGQSLPPPPSRDDD